MTQCKPSEANGHSVTQQHALPGRIVRGGAGVVVTVTRRSVAYAQPAGGTRLQRMAAPLLLVPALAILLALATILLVIMIAVAAVFSVLIALSAFFVGRRFSRSL
jgi:hypothetical protein